MECENAFKNIGQKILPRTISDHSPTILECGNWERINSHFKFENWWLEEEGFTDLIHNWSESEVEGLPDYMLSIKLKLLKNKIEVWSKGKFR